MILHLNFLSNKHIEIFTLNNRINGKCFGTLNDREFKQIQNNYELENRDEGPQRLLLLVLINRNLYAQRLVNEVLFSLHSLPSFCGKEFRLFNDSTSVIGSHAHG